jgi:hypothetical protein
VFCNISYEGTAKWETPQIFQGGQVICARSAGAFVIKSANLLRVYREVVACVMTSYTNHVKTSAERYSGRKPKLSGNDCNLLIRIVSKNPKNAAEKVKK